MSERVAVFATAVLAAGCAVLPQTLDPSELQRLAAGTVFRDCGDCPEMGVVPAGSFTMGSPATEDRWEGGREDPQHRVVIPRAFALGRYEVTRAQFAVFVEQTGHVVGACSHWTGKAWEKDASRGWREAGFSQRDDHPVVCVSWDDARAFVQWLARKTGQRYRLPSEAEWEYAARAGSTTARYWGENAADGCRFANLGDRSLERALGLQPVADCDDGHIYSAPVGSFLSNAFGLHDMLGNAWEWTEDCWNLGHKGAPADGSAWTAGDCSQRVPRGGSWNSHPRNIRSANRGNYVAANRYYHIGFRVARD